MLDVLCLRNHFVEIAADVSRRYFKNPNVGSII